MRFLFPMIGYVCVATVLTGACGYGYLRHTGKLDDEQMLKILAVLHDVDLEEIENSQNKPEMIVPEEEPSYEQQQEQLRIATLQFDAKKKELEDSLATFDYDFKQLNSATGRYNQLKGDVDIYLKELRESVMAEAVQKVRESIEMLIAKKQAKPVIKRMIEQGEMDRVIKVLSSMSKRNQQEILRTFVGADEDIDILYRLLQAMGDGGETKQYLDKQLDELSQLKQDDN